MEVFRHLDALRGALGIPEINSGRRYSIFGGAAGLVTDDVEGLHLWIDHNGRAQLSSGLEFSLRLFRGESRDWKPCVPSLARCDAQHSKLLKLCRRVAFEDAIGEHPFVRLTEASALFGYRLAVDREGLSQHYGLSTDMLDVTGSFDVASFFAVCEWSSSNQSYEPVSDESREGFIYVVHESTLMHELSDVEEPIRILGWQPLTRPEQQRAHAVRLKVGQDFSALRSVHRFRFRQCGEVAHRIWHSFDGGNELFPKDAAAELAERARKLCCFTPDQVERAWRLLEEWSCVSFGDEERAAIAMNSSIEMVSQPTLSWDGLDVDLSDEDRRERLADVFERVRFRRAAYLS